MRDVFKVIKAACFLVFLAALPMAAVAGSVALLGYGEGHPSAFYEYQSRR